MKPGETIHVIPLEDLREHDAKETCWCKPRELEDQPDVYIHNALDGRERYEQGEVPLQ